MDLGKAFSEIMTIASAIVGLAIIATLVSNKANTSNVLRSAGGAFSGAIGAAVSPVTGGNFGGSSSFSGSYGGAGPGLYTGGNFIG